MIKPGQIEVDVYQTSSRVVHANHSFINRLMLLGICMLMLGMMSGCFVEQKRKRGIKQLHILRTNGYVEYVTKYRSNDQRSKVGAGTTKSKESIFEENIKLEMDGYVYHPNFLEFSAAGLFGLLQYDYEDVFNNRKRTTSDPGTIVEFDVSGQFLKKKSYPFSIYARRQRNLQPRAFQSSLEVTTTNYGFIWRIIDEKMPTSLQFSDSDVRLEPLSDFEQNGRQQNTLLRFDTEYRFSDNNYLSFNYEYRKTQEEPFGFNYDTNELTLSHNLNFGPQKQHRLESTLNNYDQKGSFQIKRVRWREIVRFQHTENVRSWYQFEAIDRKQGNLAGVVPLEERSYSISGTIEHRVYDSLVTQFHSYGQTQNFNSNLDINRYGAQVSLDYRKKNRWGSLLATYQGRLEREDRKGGEQIIEILDERHTFDDLQPRVLSNTRIRTSSIFVTGEDRTTTYLQGRDYSVRQLGDQVELERIPTGRIIDGQTVLIDYLFQVGGSFTLDTMSQQMSLRQRFNMGLEPYVRYLKQDQTVTPTETSGVTPETISAYLIGVEYKHDTLRLGIEYEDHYSNINPFVAIRANASLKRRFSRGAMGQLRLRWSDITYFDPNARDLKFFTAEGRYRHPITPKFIVETSVLYRQENDSLSGDDEGIDIDFTLEWNIRQTEIRLTYEYGKFQDVFASNEQTALYLQIRRSF